MFHGIVTFECPVGRVQCLVLCHALQQLLDDYSIVNARVTGVDLNMVVAGDG